MGVASKQTVFPKELLWLQDAPMFIDRRQVEAFYDAIVRPKAKLEGTTFTISDEKASELKTALGLEGGLELGSIVGALTEVLGFKPSLKGTGSGEYGKSSTEGHETAQQFREIDTPERQLTLLVGHYLLNHPKRLFLPTPVADAAWRNPIEVSSVPRALAFIDLPSRDEAAAANLPRTKLIPMAAEFGDGSIDPVFTQIVADNGERSPRYPDESDREQRQDEYQAYWQWFDKHFSSRRTMEIVERAASQHGGRIKWIDYRVPLTREGHTLHLHMSPGGEYDTGVFAYNLIKRGYTHGIRLVGTLKSGPDMNVLAIYEK